MILKKYTVFLHDNRLRKGAKAMLIFLYLVIYACSMVFSAGLWEYFGIRMNSGIEHTAGDVHQLFVTLAILAALAVVTSIAARVVHYKKYGGNPGGKYILRIRLIITYIILNPAAWVIELLINGRENDLPAFIRSYGTAPFCGKAGLVMLAGLLLCCGFTLFARKPALALAEYGDGDVLKGRSKEYFAVTNEEMFPLLMRRRDLKEGTGSFAREYIAWVRDNMDSYVPHVGKHDPTSKMLEEQSAGISSLWTDLSEWLITACGATVTAR